MPYVGRDLQRGNYLKLDDIASSFDGSTTTFNLQSGGSAFYPGSAFSIFVVLSGLAQEPESAYTINKNTITFASAPSSVDDCFITALGVALGVGVPGHGTVNGSQLAKPFNYDGGLLYLDSTNDRVGVGITTPGYTLDVNGVANFRGNVSIAGTLTYQDVASIDAVGIATFQDDVYFNGAGAGISSSYWDSSANEFKFKDNVKLSFGDGRDIQLSHNGSDSVISHIGSATGALKILSGGAQSIECIKAGAVNIAHNGTSRLVTTGTGVNITDNLNVAGIATIGGYADIRTGSSINTNATGGSASGTLHKNTTSGEFAVVSGGTGGNNYLSFYTSASAAPTEKFRIEADGHTQIGLIGLSGGNDHGLTITEPGGTSNVLELATGNATGRINLSRNLSSTLNTTSYISWTEPGAQGTGEIRFGTSPSSNSPVDRLYITSTGLVTQKATWTNTYAANDTTQCGYQVQNLSGTTNTYAALRLTAGDTSAATAQLSSIRAGAGANDFTIQLEASNTAFEALRIVSSGHIVTQGLTDPSFNNDSANAKILEVTGDGTVGEYGAINISGNINADNTSVGVLRFINRENSNSSSGSHANSKALATIKAYTVTDDSNAGDDCGGYLTFSTKTEANSDNSERARIDSRGRVLIGGNAKAGDGRLIVYSSDKKHPSIKCAGTSNSNANGYTMLGDNYLADESQVNLGVSYSSSGFVLSRGVKVSDTTDDVYLSSQDSYSNRPSAFKFKSDGSFSFLNTSTNATTATDSAVALIERLRISNTGEVWCSAGNLKLGTTSGTDSIIHTTNAAGILYRADENGHRFQTYASGWQDRLTIKDNGNIGIGEVDPATLLEVSAGTNKNLNVWSSGAYATGITIGSANDAFSAYTPIEFRGSEFYFHNGTAEKVRITSGGNVNIGGNYTQTTYTMRVTGSFAATTKSFVIDHPTKENHKLRYACLEGPENSVYVRGRSSDSVIELPDYWVGLVHDDSITVNVTPIGNKNVWVESINNNSVTIGSDDSTEYFYTVFAERKDVEKLEVEVEK